MSWAREDDQLSIEHDERPIAELKQEAHLWQARCEEVQCLYNEREDQMAEARAIVKILTFFKPGECPFCLNDGSAHSQMCLTTRACVLLARMETVDDL